MKQVTLIKQTLQPHLGRHGARMMFLALFWVALFRVENVCKTSDRVHRQRQTGLELQAVAAVF